MGDMGDDNGKYGEYLALSWAVDAANRSECLKSQRGVAIWMPGERVARATGWNHQPGSHECDGSAECRASCGKLCIHAEADALMAIGCPHRNPDERPADALHMVHVKIAGDVQQHSGAPSCWQCSRLILAHGAIAAMWLLHSDGLRMYSPPEFHELTLAHLHLPVTQSCHE